MTIAKQLAEQGDPSHLAPRHVCEKCRCRRVAGQATSGWYYWPEDNDAGLGEVGHFGVGRCYWHGEGRKKRFGSGRGTAHLLEEIMNGIEATKMQGLTRLKNDDWVLDVRKDVELAESTKDIETALDHIRETLTGYKKRIEQGRKSTELSEKLSEVLDHVVNMDELSTKEIYRITGILEDRILREECLTEKAKGGIIEMTSDTMIKNDVLIAKALSQIAKDHFSAQSEKYVHESEMKRFVYKVVGLLERFIPNQEDREKAMGELKNAVLQIDEGRQKRGRPKA